MGDVDGFCDYLEQHAAGRAHAQRARDLGVVLGYSDRALRALPNGRLQQMGTHGNTDEQLVRTCARCGYQWAEACLPPETGGNRA